MVSQYDVKLDSYQGISGLKRHNFIEYYSLIAGLYGVAICLSDQRIGLLS